MGLTGGVAGSTIGRSAGTANSHGGSGGSLSVGGGAGIGAATGGVAGISGAGSAGTRGGAAGTSSGGSGGSGGGATAGAAGVNASGTAGSAGFTLSQTELNFTGECTFTPQTFNITNTSNVPLSWHASGDVGSPVTPATGSLFSGTVASGTAASGSQFSALAVSIDWGDQTVSAGSVVATLLPAVTPLSFMVTGSHTTPLPLASKAS